MARRIVLFIAAVLWRTALWAQCSMCTKTAACLDDKAARGLNAGIIYLAFLPLTMIIIIGYRWWKQHRDTA